VLSEPSLVTITVDRGRRTWWWDSGERVPRRATERGSIADAVEELMQIAGGRRDILAETAGITVGSWSAHPSMCVGTELFVGGLLIYAGADLRQLDRWFAVGRDRAGVSGPRSTAKA